MAGTIQEFDFDVDLLRAILWQYDRSVNLQALLQEKKAWYDANQTAFWEDWRRDVFDLRTANQFGLVVWSIILGFPLYVNTAPPVDQDPWGFEGSGAVNFDNGNFVDPNGSSVMLPIATQRRALQLRYFQLTSSGTVPEVNRMLKYVFGDLGSAFLLDYRNMSQAYVFNFPVTWDLAYLFNHYDVLPRPAGVRSGYIDATLTYFGFNSFNYNFDNGGFGA
jgi:hypothetical protein